MTLTATIADANTILTECAVSERLRRNPAITLHPSLFVTPLIYDSYASEQLANIYRQYRTIALEAGLPMLLCAPTWRLDQMRIAAAGYDGALIDDAVAYMRNIATSWNDADSPLHLGAYMAPKNDCYTPEQALSADEAHSFHSWQAHRLAANGVDCVVTQTVPAVSEALGIARALEESGIDAIISFVINRHGEVLDATPLAEAVKIIDDKTARAPLGYMVNCVYPTFLCAERQPASLFTRLIGIQANSSSLDHSELDGSEILHQDDLHHWGENMLRLNREFGLKILGGCCGTDEIYLRYLARST